MGAASCTTRFHRLQCVTMSALARTFTFASRSLLRRGGSAGGKGPKLGHYDPHNFQRAGDSWPIPMGSANKAKLAIIMTLFVGTASAIPFVAVAHSMSKS